MQQIIIGDAKIEYQLKRSNRRTLGLEVTSEGNVIVRAPFSTSMTTIEKLLHQKVNWILKHTNGKEKIEKEKNIVFYKGKKYHRLLKKTNRQTITVAFEKDNIVIEQPLGIEIEVEKVLELFMRRQAKQVITEKVIEYSKKMNVSFGRITIKDQKTRWGSCSGKGNLNFNYRLIMAPEEVLDYVVVHELAHRTHMDHSAAFWNYVRKYMPDYEERREWLRLHGHELSL